MAWHYTHLLVLIVYFIQSVKSVSFSSTYTKLNVTNNAVGEWKAVCANIQPSRRPESHSRLFKLPFVVNEVADPAMLCSDLQQVNLSGQILVSKYADYPRPTGGKCSVKERITRGQLYNASAFLFRAEILYSTFYVEEFNNDTNITIPIFYVNEHNYQEIEQLRGHSVASDLTVQVIRGGWKWFHGAFLLILLLSVLCVALGGLWSGHKRITLTLGESERAEAKGERGVPKAAAESAAEPLNCISLGFLLIFVVVFLLLFYYFFGIFVWFILVVFTIMTSISTYACMSLIWEAFFGDRCEIPKADLGWLLSKLCRCLSVMPDVYVYSYRQIFMYLFSAAMSITWCVMRKNPYSFILHSAMSVMFCVYTTANVRIQSLKWITALMTALLVYDLFMVFITPFFTSEGCSIMVEAVTGGACSQKTVSPPDPAKEEIPIVFRIPDFTDVTFDCYNMTIDLQFPPVILGFGDVILPGLLVGFNYAFDLGWNVKYYIYFVIAVIGYLLGMTVTFLALVLMNTAQPALIYLVPFTVIPTHIVALCKGHWWHMWRGNVLSTAREPHTPTVTGPEAKRASEEEEDSCDRQPLETPSE